MAIITHILTGFLGSGKTTLLNELLKNKALANTAVIINEFGEAGLDHLFIEQSDDQIIELSNGCLCCTVRGQLVETLETIISRKPDRIIIETTGLADPAPIIQALIKSPSLEKDICFGAMITACDLIHGINTIRKHEEAKKQILFADIICLTKEDIAGNVAKENAIKTLNKLNPNAKIIDKEIFLSAPIFEKTAAHINLETHHDHHHEHHHDVNIHSDAICCTTLKHDGSIAAHKIEMFLDLLFSAHAQHILRLKGLVNIKGESTPLLIHGVSGILATPSHLQQWPDENKQTRIVIFLEKLDAQFVQRLFAGFIGTPLIDSPDDQALTNSPLTVSGFTPKLD